MVDDQKGIQMIISKKKYQELVESRDAWKKLCIEVNQQNKELLECCKAVNQQNKELVHHLEVSMKELEAYKKKVEGHQVT